MGQVKFPGKNKSPAAGVAKRLNRWSKTAKSSPMMRACARDKKLGVLSRQLTQLLTSQDSGAKTYERTVESMSKTRNQCFEALDDTRDCVHTLTVKLAAVVDKLDSAKKKPSPQTVQAVKHTAKVMGRYDKDLRSFRMDLSDEKSAQGAAKRVAQSVKDWQGVESTASDCPKQIGAFVSKAVVGKRLRDVAQRCQAVQAEMHEAARLDPDAIDHQIRTVRTKMCTVLQEQAGKSKSKKSDANVVLKELLKL